MSDSIGDGYKDKCKQLERKIKEMIFLNAALEDEVKECKQNVTRSRADRKILLNKLLSFEKIENGQPAEPPVVNGTSSKRASKVTSKTATKGESYSGSSKRKKTDVVPVLLVTPESLPSTKSSSVAINPNHV